MAHKTAKNPGSEDLGQEALKKKLEERYMALKMIDQQFKQTQKQIQLIEQQAGELDSTKEALDDLKNVKEGTEILVPIANGVFAKATINSPNKLIVNVGAGASVTKGLDDIKKIVESQADELHKLGEELSEQMQMLAAQAQAIETEMESLS